jgi:hypothetical protein
MNLLDQLNPFSYAFLARTRPVLFVSVPLAAATWVWTSEWLGGWSWIASLLVAAGVPQLMGEMAADKGRAKEPELWKSWGGQPTTHLLRHRTAILNPESLRHIHLSLTKITRISLPTAAEESADPVEADRLYSACVDRIRVTARENSTEYKTVYDANVNYGFRRNLWAIKSWAIASAGVSIILALVQIYLFGGPLGTLGVVVISVVFLLFVIFKVRAAWVRAAATVYAARLLECAPRMVPK